MELFPGYCIDTCALVDLWRRYYPRDIFPSLWSEFEKLVKGGEIIAPGEVLEELATYHDAKDPLLQWAKENGDIFVPIDNEQSRRLKDIMGLFGDDLINPYEVKVNADPLLIALAESRGWKVITSENRSPKGKPRIPDVCERLDIPCLSLLDFFRERDWRF